jgi:hypothetical protein
MALTHGFGTVFFVEAGGRVRHVLFSQVVGLFSLAVVGCNSETNCVNASCSTDIVQPPDDVPNQG